MSFVRTVLGDIPPGEMGLTYSHEHIIIDESFPTISNKDFILNCLEYLVNDGGIMETRNKDFVLRILDTKKVNDQKTLWQLVNIAAPILLIIFFGFIYQQIRKRKYSI